MNIHLRNFRYLIFAFVKCVMHFMFVIFIIRLSGMGCP